MNLSRWPLLAIASVLLLVGAYRYASTMGGLLAGSGLVILGVWVAVEILESRNDEH